VHTSAVSCVSPLSIGFPREPFSIAAPISLGLRVKFVVPIFNRGLFF
jgi:hypothetical protein